MIEAGGMAFTAVAPPAEGPPQSQSRTARAGGEPFERAMARARKAEERGTRPRGAAAEVPAEATDEEPQAERPADAEASGAVAVPPEVAAIIEALVAPQPTQPDRTAEVGVQQEPSLMATVSEVLASFEAPVPAVAWPQGVAAAEASAAPVIVEPALEAGGIALDGLEAVSPEATVELVDVPPTSRAPAVAVEASEGSEAAAPRGVAETTVEPIDLEAARESEAANVATPAADLGSESGESSDGESTQAALPDTDNAMAAPRGADAPATNVAPPIEATAASSVGRATETTVAQPAVEVEAVARPVDTSNAPQLASRLADTVQAAVRTGDHSMRLVLNPPDLGQLDVRVVERPDGVTVTLAAESSHARDLLQQHLPALRAALEARDVRVDRLDVTQGSNAAGLGEANDEPRGRREQQGNERPDWSLAAALDGAAAASTRTGGGSSGTRLVDLRA